MTKDERDREALARVFAGLVIFLRALARAKRHLDVVFGDTTDDADGALRAAVEAVTNAQANVDTELQMIVLLGRTPFTEDLEKSMRAVRWLSPSALDKFADGVRCCANDIAEGTVPITPSPPPPAPALAEVA